MKILSGNGLFRNTVQACKKYAKKLLDSGIHLKTLVKDTFTKTSKSAPKNVRHKGDTYQHIPEFITKDGDTAGITIRNMKFSKEETEKMSKMSLDDMMAYKAKLIEKGQYTYEN